MKIKSDNESEKHSETRLETIRSLKHLGYVLVFTIIAYVLITFLWKVYQKNKAEEMEYNKELVSYLKKTDSPLTCKAGCSSPRVEVVDYTIFEEREGYIIEDIDTGKKFDLSDCETERIVN